MAVSKWTAAQTKRAEEIWAEYQRTHDVSDRQGQAVGIDPATGEVWFGESASEIVDRLKSRGATPPLLFTRVGERGYVRKGGRR